jgi:hypothetical protein
MASPPSPDFGAASSWMPRPATGAATTSLGSGPALTRTTPGAAPPPPVAGVPPAAPTFAPPGPPARQVSPLSPPGAAGLPPERAANAQDLPPELPWTLEIPAIRPVPGVPAITPRSPLEALGSSTAASRGPAATVGTPNLETLPPPSSSAPTDPLARLAQMTKGLPPLDDLDALPSAAAPAAPGFSLGEPAAATPFEPHTAPPAFSAFDQRAERRRSRLPLLGALVLVAALGLTAYLLRDTLLPWIERVQAGRAAESDTAGPGAPSPSNPASTAPGGSTAVELARARRRARAAAGAAAPGTAATAATAPGAAAFSGPGAAVPPGSGAAVPSSAQASAAPGAAAFSSSPNAAGPQRGGKASSSPASAAGAVPAASGAPGVRTATGPSTPAGPPAAATSASSPSSAIAGSPTAPASASASRPGAGHAAPAAATPSSAPTPSSASSAASAAATGGAVTGITKITWQASRGGTDVVLWGNGPFAAKSFSHVRVGGQPVREVVRLSGITRPFSQARLAARTAELTQIRVGAHPPHDLHVVLDLTGSEVAVSGIEARANQLVIHLRDTARH